MKKELKTKWIEALRSGKYKQGKQNLMYLENGELRHCCLGVLCEVRGYKMTKTDNRAFMVDEPSLIAPEIGITFLLPVELCIDLGLDHDREMEMLWQLNDGRIFNEETKFETTVTPKTFDEIADWIEENVAVDEDTITSNTQPN